MSAGGGLIALNNLEQFSSTKWEKLLGPGKVSGHSTAARLMALHQKPSRKQAKASAGLDITGAGFCPLLCRVVRTASPGILRVGSPGGEGASRNEPATGRGTKATV